MISEYIQERNEHFSSLFRKGFDVERSYVITDGLHKYDRVDVLEKIKQYMFFLDELKVKSVMLLMEPNYTSLCLLYALVLSNRTVIICPENSSSEFLKSELLTTNADIILMGKDSSLQHRGKYFPLLTLHSESQVFYYRNREQKKINLLPGIMWYTSNKGDGAQLCHYLYKTLADHLSNFIKEYHLSSSDNFLLDKMLSYNICIRAIFLPLIVGGKLTILTPSKLTSIELLISIIQKDTISILDLSSGVFSTLQNWLIKNRQGSKVVSLRKIFFDQQLPSFYNFQQWFKYINPSQNFYKLYSATEYFNIFSYKVSPSNEYEDLYQLGGVTHKSDYLLVENTKETYDLFVSGAHTTGYFDVFKSLQYFAIDNGRRYFKTDDLVKVGDDKLYYYAERRQIFVKNNHEINLFRVEQEFYHHAPLGRAAVIAGFMGDITLYIEGSNDAEDIHQLKTHFKQALPSYMQIDFYEFKRSLPTTVSGSVDYDVLRKDVLAFFKNLFIGGHVNDRSKLNQFNLTDIEYFKLSEYIIARTGYFYDVTKDQANIEVGDIKGHLEPIPKDKDGYVRQVFLSKYLIDTHIQPLLKQGQDKGCFIYRLPLKRQVSLYKLKSAIVNTVKAHFLLSCKVVNQSEHFFLVRVKPNTDIINKKSHMFSSFRPIENSQLIMSANADQLFNIFIEKKGDESQLIISYHAMILDLWSFKNLLSEIFSRYEDRHITNVPDSKTQVRHLNRVYQKGYGAKKDISRMIEIFNRFPNVNMQTLLPLFHVNNLTVNSLLHLSKEDIEQYKTQFALSQEADASVFLLLSYLSISRVLEIDSLVIHIVLLNRLGQSMYASKLTLNNETELPLTVIPHSHYAQMTAYFSMMLSYYFYHMDIDTIGRIHDEPQFISWQKKQIFDEFKLRYAFIPFDQDQSCYHEGLIDWNSAEYAHENFSHGLISFKVIELEHSYIVHLDSKIASGIHQKLESEFKKILKDG